MAIVAAIQMASTQDVQTNITIACQLIEQAAKKGAHLAALPENFVTIGLTPAQSVAVAEPFQEGFIQQQLAHCAKKNKIWIIGGTIPLKADGHKLFSSCLVWDENGELAARYDKIHMFDVTVGSGDEYRESDTVKAGKQIGVVQTPIGKIGLAVCYDLRFPELFRNFMLKGVDAIVLPSAFTIETGKAHWETLLKARAIENLCYVIAPAEGGLRANGIGTYGHSMIIGPWGEVLASLEKGSGVILAKIDLEKMHQLRQRFPALTHYRSFVMQELVKESQR